MPQQQRRRHRASFAHSFNDLCSEASLMATLQHENIAVLFGFALFPAPALVMELCAGGDLDAYLRNTLPTQVTWRTRRHIAFDVNTCTGVHARALGAAS